MRATGASPTVTACSRPCAFAPDASGCWSGTSSGCSRAVAGSAWRARAWVRCAARREDAVLKLILTRGVGSRGYRPSGNERSTRVLALHPLPPPPPQTAHLRLCALRLSRQPRLAGLKTLNRLEQVLARAEWSEPGIFEGLLRDARGQLVCGTFSNFFLRRGSLLWTPRLDQCGV